jgi:hypothetical protein
LTKLSVDQLAGPPADRITTGPGAAAAWGDLTTERKAAVLRFLFAAIRINTGRRGRGFDYDRIDIEQNPL